MGFFVVSLLVGACYGNKLLDFEVLFFRGEGLVMSLFSMEYYCICMYIYRYTVYLQDWIIIPKVRHFGSCSGKYRQYS